MKGQIYSVGYAAVGVSVISDLLEITAPSDAIVRIHSAHVGQTTDYGDAEAEGLRVAWTRYATAGTGGTTMTPAPHSLGVTASSTVKRNMAAQGSTPTEVQELAYNLQSGWFYLPIPEERIIIPPSGIFSLELTKAPADSITLALNVTFEEIGNH